MSEVDMKEETQTEEAGQQEPASKPQDKPVDDKKHHSKTALIMTWLALAVFAVGALLLSNKVQKLEEQMAHTPPVVVIDFVRLVDSYGTDADPADLEARMMQTRQQVEALRDAGYLVLDASNVIAAPDALFLPTGQGE